MKIYLDNCCFNIPFDDQKQEKIYLETEAKLFIQRRIKDKEYNLVWSFIIDYENYMNPDRNARDSIQYWEKVASETVISNNSIIERSKEMHDLGFGIKDSLHLSCAIESSAKYFLTVDKKILNKRELVNNIKIINPVDFIELEEDL